MEHSTIELRSTQVEKIKRRQQVPRVGEELRLCGHGVGIINGLADYGGTTSLPT